MKAISVKQPWAWAIAEGYKTIETRVWSTTHRGDLLIVASLKPDQLVLDAFTEEFGYAVLARQLEYGKALCTARLIDCRPMTKADEEAARCDVYDGAFSWVLEDVRKIKPFPVKGRLGLYEVDYEA